MLYGFYSCSNLSLNKTFCLWTKIMTYYLKHVWVPLIQLLNETQDHYHRTSNESSSDVSPYGTFKPVLTDCLYPVFTGGYLFSNEYFCHFVLSRVVCWWSRRLTHCTQNLLWVQTSYPGSYC